MTAILQRNQAAQVSELTCGLPERVKGRALRRGLSLVTLAWLSGSIWCTAIAGTPVTNFAKALHASNFQFGLLAALPFITSLLSMPASVLIEATGQRCRIFQWALCTQRVLWIPIGLVPWWMIHHWGPAAGGAAMVVYLWLMFLMYSGQSIGNPAWTSWMADLVPERIRGTYFSRRRQLGILTALPTGLLVGWVLDGKTGRGADPMVMLRWCAYIFLASSVFGFLDIFTFRFVPQIPKAPQAGRHLLRAMREPLRNRQFLWFGGFVATMIFAVSFMGQFSTLYVIDQVTRRGWRVNITTQLMLIVAPMLAQLLVFSAWGKAADRMGKRPLLVLSGLGMVPVAVGWCFLGAGNIWLGFVLACAGAVIWCGIDISNFNLLLELSGSGEGDENNGGSAYVAVNTVITSLAGGLGGLAAGLIAQTLGSRHWQLVTPFKVLTYFDVLFLLSAVLRLLAVVVFLPHIHEAGARPAREALRFMTANIYNNLFNAVTAPLRLIGMGRRHPRARRG